MSLIIWYKLNLKKQNILKHKKSTMKKLLIYVAALTILTVTTNAQIGGYALKFDGTNDYVSVPHVSSLNFGTSTNFTIEAWILLDGAVGDYAGIAAKGEVDINTGEWYGYQLVIVGQKIAGEIKSPNGFLGTFNGLIGTSSLLDYKWHHVAMSVNRSTGNVKLYVDGKIETDVTNTDAIGGDLNNNAALLIGSERDKNRYINGLIDEVRLWNVVRTEAEIKANMFKEIGTHTNLKSYYKMSDGSGTSLTDNSGNSNTGALTNGPVWKMSGAFAGSRHALDFDGSNDYVSFDTNNSPTYNNASFSMEAWIKTSSTGQEDEIIGLGGWSNNVLEFRLNEGKLQLGTDVSYWEVVTSQSNINTGIWTHVAYVKNGSNVSIYVNGNLDAQGSINQTPNVSVMTIGNLFQNGNMHSNRYEFLGAIDEVRVWNSARTGNQIRENMMKTLVGNETDLLAYYRFDQMGGTTLYDQTANAKNGTLTNMDASSDWIASTAFNTWLGGESSSMGTAANWSSGVVPTATDNVGIYKWGLGNELNVSSEVNTGSVLVSANANPSLDAAINTTGAFIPLRNVNLKLSTNNAIGAINNPTGNELIVPADAKVTVSTAIDNAGKIILKSNDTNSAQIKNTGTAPTPGTVILRKDLKASTGWYFVGFPFDVTLTNIKKTSTQTSVTIGDYKTATGPSYSDLYIIEYNGIRRDQTGTAYATNSPNWDAVTTGTLSAKKGYAIRVISDIEIDFIGTSNADMFANADKSATVGNQHTNGNVIHHGWNLVGLPYTTAFNINNLNQGAYFYVYDQSNQNYMVKEKNVDTYQLNAFGAFFMQASSTNLTFANAGRALKAPVVVSVPEYSKIDLAITNGTFTDNTQIRLMEGAENSYELNKDAAKMLSLNSAVPQLWTKAETFDVAINALPENTQEVKLGIRLGSTGSYTIRLNEISQNQTAILVDNINGTRINLAENKRYSFNSNTSGTITDRFKIITGTDVNTSVLTAPTSGNVKIEINKDNMIFSGLEEKSTVRVYDTKSTMLATYINVQNYQALKLNTTSNIVLVVVENRYGIKTFKLHTNL